MTEDELRAITRDAVGIAAARLGTPLVTSYEFTCIEAVNHQVMLAEANALGALGWQMITTDRPHEFWIAVMQRERITGCDPTPAAIDRTGVGAFGVMGGDADGRLA